MQKEPLTGDDIHAQIVRKLEQWVEAMPDPDEPIIGLAGGLAGDSEETLSPRQILEHVQRQTALGQDLEKRWVALALEHVMQATVAAGA